MDTMGDRSGGHQIVGTDIESLSQPLDGLAVIKSVMEMKASVKRFDHYLATD